MCAYILQTLSAERAFGAALSARAPGVSLPAKWAVPGSTADLLIVVRLPSPSTLLHPLHSSPAITLTSSLSPVRARVQSLYAIATTPGLNPLLPALTITIANVAPTIQELGVQASTRLIQLFHALASPAFLLKDEGHPRLVNSLYVSRNH